MWFRTSGTLGDPPDAPAGRGRSRGVGPLGGDRPPPPGTLSLDSVTLRKWSQTRRRGLGVTTVSAGSVASPPQNPAEEEGQRRSTAAES